MKTINRKFLAFFISVAMLMTLSVTAVATDASTTEMYPESSKEVQTASVKADYPITLSGYLGSADTVIPITTSVNNKKPTVIFNSNNSEGICTYRITIEGSGYSESIDTIGDAEGHMYHLPEMKAGNYTITIHRLSGKGTNYYVLMLLNNYT